MTLSKEQFRDLTGAVNDPDIGGFTVHASGPNAGKSPTNVYAVGTRAEERVAPLPARSSMFEEHAQRHAAKLDNPRRYLGGWQEKGNAYADIPRGYPTTPAGETAARHATLRENQEGFGVLGPKGYMGTAYNPFHPANQGGDITAGNPQADAAVWANMPKHTGMTTLNSMQMRAARER